MWRDFIAPSVRSGGLVHRPGTLSQVSEFTQTFLTHYNDERPNQARSCGNQPPQVACPAFPTLPAVPRTVDPDRWLLQVNKQAFARTIQAGGDLTINRQDYYVSRKLAGKPGDVLGQRSREAIRDLAARGAHQVGPDQRLAWKDDVLPGVCGADEGGSTLGISAVSTHPSKADSRSPVGLSSQASASRDEMTISRVDCA